MIFIENIYILIAGMLIGTLSAGIAILPSLLSPAFSMDLLTLGIILLLVFLTGLISIYIPARSSMKKTLIEGLRTE